MGVKNFKIICASCSIITLLAGNRIPEYYKVDFTNNEFQKLTGYYKKVDKTKKENTSFKKPRLENYLKVDDGEWMLEDKVNGLRIKMDKDGNYVPESGKWKAIKANGDDIDIDVSITEYTPEYPEYYKVGSTEKHLEGFYKKQPDSQNFLGFPVFEKRRPNYSLFLQSRGMWTICQEVSEHAGNGLAQSLGKGLPDPQLAKGWKVWKFRSWEEEARNFQIIPLNPFFCARYNVEYAGTDPDIRRKLDDKKVLGTYTKLDNNHDSVPVYAKSSGEMNMYRLDGQWVFSFYVSNYLEETILNQDSNGSPTPRQDLNWKYEYDVIDLTLTPLQEERDGRVKSGFEDSSINNVAQDSGNKDEDTSKNSDTILIIVIVFSFIAIIAILIITGIFMKKKINQKEEEPTVDDNMYYGDDYYDKEEDTAVVDSNDYYELS